VFICNTWSKSLAKSRKFRGKGFRKRIRPLLPQVAMLCTAGATFLRFLSHMDLYNFTDRQMFRQKQVQYFIFAHQFLGVIVLNLLMLAMSNLTKVTVISSQPSSTEWLAGVLLGLGLLQYLSSFMMEEMRLDFISELIWTVVAYLSAISLFIIMWKNFKSIQNSMQTMTKRQGKLRPIIILNWRLTLTLGGMLVVQIMFSVWHYILTAPEDPDPIVHEFVQTCLLLGIASICTCLVRMLEFSPTSILTRWAFRRFGKTAVTDNGIDTSSLQTPSKTGTSNIVTKTQTHPSSAGTVYVCTDYKHEPGLEAGWGEDSDSEPEMCEVP